MRCSAIAILFLLGVAQFLSAQSPHYRDDASARYEERIARLEAERAALREEMKTARQEIDKLRTALKEVRQQAGTALDTSKAASDELDEIKWVGRVILSAVAFLIGVIVTQWISRFMTARKPRVIRSA